MSSQIKPNKIGQEVLSARGQSVDVDATLRPIMKLGQ